MPAATKSRRVLLVQRPNDDVDMYVEFFAAHHFTMIVVSTAEAALAAAKDADVAITDIELDGDVSGCDLVRRLREGASTRWMPIIVLTAAAWKTDRQRAMAAGSDVFLAKPCVPSELLDHVQRLLSRGGPRPPSRVLP